MIMENIWLHRARNILILVSRITKIDHISEKSGALFRLSTIVEEIVIIPSFFALSSDWSSMIWLWFYKYTNIYSQITFIHNAPSPLKVSQALAQEVLSLETLSGQLFAELDDLHMEMERLYFAKTWQGQYFNFLGYIFSVYCLYKIIMVRTIIAWLSQSTLTRSVHCDLYDVHSRPNEFIIILERII